MLCYKKFYADYQIIPIKPFDLLPAHEILHLSFFSAIHSLWYFLHLYVVRAAQIASIEDGLYVGGSFFYEFPAAVTCDLPPQC